MYHGKIAPSTPWLLWIMLLRIRHVYTWIYKYLFKILLSIPPAIYLEAWFAGTYAKSIFEFLKKCHTIFHKDWIILHFCQQYTKVPVSPRPHQYFYFCYIFIAFSKHINKCKRLTSQENIGNIYNKRLMT